MIRLAMLVLIALLGVEIVRVVLGTNKHWAIPGRVLRTAQLSEATLTDTVRAYGIKTVVNLRGCSNPADWYLAETRATHAAGVSQEDITLSAYRFPAPQEIKRLVEVLDLAEYPILLHCRRGADRTGLASAIAMLLQEGSDLNAALGQLSLRYGHFRFMHAARMNDFFDFYAEDLKDRGETHTPARFRDWVANRYRPGPGAAELTLLDKRASYPKTQSIKLTVRAKNASNVDWQLKPGTYAGIHGRYFVIDFSGKIVVHERMGLFHATVKPCESIDLVVGIPPLKVAGTYHLLIDMCENQAVSFTQLGAEPIYDSLTVTD